jgi:hypothetical protein
MFIIKMSSNGIEEDDEADFTNIPFKATFLRADR